MESFSCDVFRLHNAPKVTADQLTRDGQYAPRKSSIRRIRGICKVTGINFEADLALQTSAVSSLSVFHEHELAQANVIENYLRIFSAHRVLQQGGVVLHSAGLVFDDKAYIFSGKSNAGKTTLTRKAYRIGARVLSDDINLLLPSEDGKNFDAYAVPFSGEFGRTLDHTGSNESYPVAGIILLEQDDRPGNARVICLGSRCQVTDRFSICKYG